MVEGYSRLRQDFSLDGAVFLLCFGLPCQSGHEVLFRCMAVCIDLLCACVRACVRARACVRVRACVRACVRVCVCAPARISLLLSIQLFLAVKHLG